MPAAEPNKAIRILVPAVVTSLVVLLVAIMFTGGTNRVKNAPTPDADPANPAQVEGTGAPAASPPAAAPSETPGETAGDALAVDEPVEQPEITLGDASLAGLRALGVGRPEGGPATIGALDDPATEERDTDYEFELHFARAGAGIESIVAAHHYETIKREKHYVIQQRDVIDSTSMSALATRAVEINGQAISLFGTDGGEYVWNETAPGSFVCEIVNDDDETVARIEKTYALLEHSFDIEVEQRFVNLTDQPMSVKWYQYGPVDLSADFSGYHIDVRRVRLGHLLDARRDPGGVFVDGYQSLTSRNSVLKKATKKNNPFVWEGAAAEGTGPLVWIAQTGRYFAFAVHKHVEPGAAVQDKALPLADVVRAVPFQNYLPEPNTVDRLILQLESGPYTVAPGGTLDRSFGVYAGPLGKRELVTGKTVSGTPDPYLSVYESLRLDGLIVYNLGGMCAMCTFQPLARVLLRFLMFAHDNLVFDWALAIMLLVLVVRTILHPIYKRSQISLQTFTRQMQRIAPKQKKLQEKYKDDPKKMQAEMARLMREENVKFTGALGCLPMFLQSPIWIALYAMLYFLFDLRHEAAFYGVFQNISGGAWKFLGDLSSPDRFIDFGHTIVQLPLMGDIRSINILPLLLGLVFYVHQKYISPPPSATMTDEQKQQQKIMKVIMVVMFPVFMYNAPSGLAIYFITNSALGIIEGRWIRAHIDQLDLDNKVEQMATEGRKRVANKAPKTPAGIAKGKSKGEGPKYKKRK